MIAKQEKQYRRRKKRTNQRNEKRNVGEYGRKEVDLAYIKNRSASRGEQLSLTEEEKEKAKERDGTVKGVREGKGNKIKGREI